MGPRYTTAGNFGQRFRIPICSFLLAHCNPSGQGTTERTAQATTQPLLAASPAAKRLVRRASPQARLNPPTLRVQPSTWRETDMTLIGSPKASCRYNWAARPPPHPRNQNRMEAPIFQLLKILSSEYGGSQAQRSRRGDIRQLLSHQRRSPPCVEAKIPPDHPSVAGAPDSVQSAF